MPGEATPTNISIFGKSVVAYGAVWLLALVVRLVFLWQMHSTDVFNLLIGDGVRYDAWAQSIAGGDWLGQGVFYQAPLYPYFMGLIYTVAGKNLLVLRLVQAVIGATSCVLLARAGAGFFSRKVGLLAGVLLALYPTAIFLDYAVQKSVLDLFFLCGLLAVLARIHEQPVGLWWIVGGVMLGLFALTRENALVLLPVILLWPFLNWRSDTLGTRLRWAGGVALGMCVVMLPVALRNQFVGGEFHLTTSQFGPNFYIGNSRYANGVYKPLIWGRASVKYEQDDARELAEQAVGRKLTPGEVSQYWTRAAFADIRQEPVRWMHLLARKCYLTWNISEISDTDDQYTYGEWSLMLRSLTRILNFGTICPLAVLGICLTWPQRRKLWLLHGLLLSYAASVVMFYVFARYRFPLVPLLLLFGAAGILSLRSAYQAGRIREIVFALTLAAVTGVVCCQPVVREEDTRGTTHYNIAADLLNQHGDEPAAFRHCAEAVRLSPSLAPAHHLLAMLLLKQDRTAEAVEQEQEAVKLRPDYAEAHFTLGGALLSLNRLDEAITHLRAAWQLSPGTEKYQTKLGEAERLKSQGDTATPRQ